MNQEQELACDLADALEKLEGEDEEAPFWGTDAHWDGEAVCVRYKKGDGYWTLSPSQARLYLKQLEGAHKGRHVSHDEKVIELTEAADQIQTRLQSADLTAIFLLHPKAFAGGGKVNVRYVEGETWWTLSLEDAKDYLKMLKTGEVARHPFHTNANEEAG